MHGLVKSMWVLGSPVSAGSMSKGSEGVDDSDRCAI